MVNPILYIITTIIDLYSFVVIAWAIIETLVSFNIMNRSQMLVMRVRYALNRLVLPALRPIRRYMPEMGGIDLSPIVLILLLGFVNYTLVYYFR